MKLTGVRTASAATAMMRSLRWRDRTTVALMTSKKPVLRDMKFGIWPGGKSAPWLAAQETRERPPRAPSCPLEDSKRVEVEGSDLRTVGNQLGKAQADL